MNLETREYLLTDMFYELVERYVISVSCGYVNSFDIGDTEIDMDSSEPKLYIWVDGFDREHYINQKEYEIYLNRFKEECDWFIDVLRRCLPNGVIIKEDYTYNLINKTDSINSCQLEFKIDLNKKEIMESD